MIEQWREISGWEGMYAVSNLGRIKSLKRMVAYQGSVNGFPIEEKVMRTALNTDGYHFLTLSRNNMPTVRLVSHLVCEAFHGPRPDGQLCRHLDDDRNNNGADNLAWGTAADNSADAIKNGRNAAGASHANAKLTEDQVRTIRVCGGSNMQTGRLFGVTEAAVRSIRSGRTWRHLHDDAQSRSQEAKKPFPEGGR